jgi:hypothetical protein
MKGLLTPGLRRAWAECREKLRHLRLHGSVEAFVDGQLTGARRARMAAHLACCWACSGYAQTLRLIKASLRRGPNRAPVSLPAIRVHRFADRLLSSPRIRGPSHDQSDRFHPTEASRTHKE